MRPLSLQVLDEAPRYLSKDDCVALGARVLPMAVGGGETWISLRSWWSGAVRWARNHSIGASDRRDIYVSVTRTVHRASGSVGTNQIDNASLQAAVRTAERIMRYHPYSPDGTVDVPVHVSYANPTIWSDATFDLSSAARGAATRALIAPAAKAGMVAAGYLEVKGGGSAAIAPTGEVLYAPSTDAQCSITVRNPEGTGSGWAGLSSYDWRTIDVHALADRALRKCLASRNPVAVEPGRYTAILEPQAVAQLTNIIVKNLSRTAAESNRGPFAGPRFGESKLGERLLDPRVSITHDPMDPQLGVVPFLGWGEPYRPVTWFDHGVLTTLSYSRAYALSELNEELGYPNSTAYRMSGGTATIDEMIATTKRGLLVTRLSNLIQIDERSLLLMGFTRDGLWLVEDGKISKPVKNFRIVESPLFVLNNIEMLGVPEPVFNPDAPVVVPPLKVRDFNFASLSDAV
jgi:predicted Zn-dependent protease